MMCNSYDDESLINKLSSFIKTGKINVPHVYYVFHPTNKLHVYELDI